MVITRSMRRKNEIHQYSMVGPVLELPLDLIIEILIRLHVKSILRFKLVCKTWYKLIENPDFTKKHHTRSKLINNLNSLLVISNDFVKRITSMWLHPIEKTHNYSNPNPNPTFRNDFTILSILGILDGLVWAKINDTDSIICNPTTGCIREIPSFCLAKIYTNIAFYGIGFKDNDYKLFRIVYLEPPNEVVVRAEMYSMTTNIWKLIDLKIGEFDDRLYGIHDMKADVVINDVIYWEAFSSSLQDMVMSFDMNTYECDRIMCPKIIGTSWQIIDLKGELALTNCADIYRFNLWVLNEKERSWTLRLKVESLWLPDSFGDDYILKCLGCERNGNFVVQHCLPHSIELFSYPDSHSIMHLPLRIEIRQKVYFYKESLIRV